MFEALTKVFLGLADQAKPLLFCLDDLHWADEMTLGWLEYLAPRLPHSNLCILATYRSEDSDPLIELRRVLSRTDGSSEVILNGLEQNAVSQMVNASGVAQGMQTGWIPKLHQATDGNPFFILEILSEVLTQGGVLEPETLPVSRNVQSIISGRLARLSILARQVLEACAVLAPRLEFELIGATSGRQEFELVEALDELTRQNLLKTADGSYLFRHDLIRQAVYQSLSQLRCHLLHKRAAAALETIYVKSIQNESALIAFHYDRADQAEQAVEYYCAAARSARAIYAYQAAVSYLQRAIELLPASLHPDDFTAGLFELLGDCQGNMGNFADARDSYNRAIQILGRDKPFITASLLRKCAAAFGGEFDYDHALPLLDLALELLESYPDSEALAWQHTWLDVQLERMFLYYQKALPEKIDEISSQIQPVLEKSGTPLQQIRFLTGLNYSAVRKNRYRVSREIVDTERYALQVAKGVGDSVLICERQFNTGILCLLYGDLQPAIEYLAAGLELSRKIGLHPIELQCLIYLIAAQRMVNNLPEVEGLVSGCMETAQLVGNPNYIGAALAHQAWLAFRSGKFETAKELALQAREQWQKTRTYPFQWMGLWLLLSLAYAQKDDSLMHQTAAALVHPLQQAAPSELEDLLHSAISAKKDQEIEKARLAVDQALRLARLFGYL
jgi:eukaryotic-like serine/threonine-protein kinase